MRKCQGEVHLRAARRGIALLVCGVVLGLAPAAGAEESTAEAAGWGVGSALASIVYAPTKIVYAIGGSVVGGLAWIFSAGDNDVAQSIIVPATRGDYVVTPANLRGQQPLEFIGRIPEPTYAAPTYAAPPAAVSSEPSAY